MKYTIEQSNQNNIILPVVRDPNEDIASDGEYTSSKDDNDEEEDKEHEEDIHEDLEPESSDSDGDMLLMLEDEYNEFSSPNKFGVLGIQQNRDEPDNLDIFVYDNHFYIPPHTQREYKLSLNQLVDNKKLNENPKFHVVCDIICNQLYNSDKMWVQSASHIVHKKDFVHLYLVNDTDKTILLDPGEEIATLDIIYMADIEEFKTFKTGNPNTKEIVNELCSLEEFMNNDFDILIYENKIKDKIDISNVPSEMKNEFLNLIYHYDHIFDWNNDKIGNIDVGEHVIKLKHDAVLRRVKPYRLSRHETECLQQELDKLLKLGIIERAGYSDWSSPLIMLKKERWHLPHRCRF